MESKLLVVSVPVLAAVMVWWVGNAIAAVASKRIMLWAGGGTTVHTWTASFQELRWVDLTSVQHVAGLVVAMIWLKASHKTLFPEEGAPRLIREDVCIAGVANVVGNLATNAAYALLSSSTALVVKACEPLVTLLLSICLYQHHTAVNVSSFLSVIMAVIGAMTVMKGDITFNVWGLVAGMVSSIAFPIRNIYLKNLSSTWDGPVQKFAVMCMISTVLVLPLSAIKLMLTLSLPTFTTTDGMISSAFHSTYNMASITVLDNFSPVTHAILNLLKRTFTIMANVVYFQVPVSWTLIISLAVLLMGCYLYHLSYTSKNRFLSFKCVILLVYFVYLMTSYSHMLLHTRASTSISMDTRISTSWVWNRNVSDNVLANIVALAKANPRSSVHVYCGTTQCVEALSTAAILRVEFVNVMDVVKDTPLEHWMVRHPINKLLSGRAFENLLHHAVKLGLLLKYGGIYVDAEARVTKELACVQDPVPWMNALIEHSQGLEVAHFPKNHSFISKLSQHFVNSQYTNRYLSQATTKRKFQFQQQILSVMKDKCLDCPTVLTDVLVEMVEGGTGRGDAHHYGTLVYDVRVQIATEVNLGDEVQGFPGMQYLPYVDTYLERDRMNVSLSPSSPRVTTFFNAWWGADDALWPPASNIEPVMVSVHIGEDMYPQWVQHVDYLKDKQPIGCRDYSTLNFLREHGVNAYFSGCMTLLMTNPNIAAHRRDIIYLVDLADEIKFMLPMDIQMRAVSVSHAYWGEDRLSNIARFTEAYDRIVMYGSAKLVITQRIHCALPCVAMGTPVIFVDFPGLFGATDTQSSPRTAGLTPLFHTLDLYTTSREKAVEWLQDFPWDQPPPNPNFGLMMKLRSTLWNTLRQHQVFYDSAKRFGLLPITQLSPAQQNVSNRTFHLVVPTSRPPTSTAHQLSHLNWRVWRCIEAILYHHPLAKVKVYSRTIRQEELSVLTEAGYQVQVQNYSVQDLLQSSPASHLSSKASLVDKYGDLLGLLLLYHYGGVYVNTDTVLVKPLDTLPMNTVGYLDKDNLTLSSTLMIFEKAHPFLHACLMELGQHSNSLANQISHLLTKLCKDSGYGVHMLPFYAFNMFDRKQVVRQCLRDTSGSKFKTNTDLLTQHAYGVYISHIYTSRINTANNIIGKLKQETLCNKIFNSYCILCNNRY